MCHLYSLTEIILYFLFRYEKLFGSIANSHFCVSKAMKKELNSHWIKRCRLNIENFEHHFEFYSFLHFSILFFGDANLYYFIYILKF